MRGTFRTVVGDATTAVEHWRLEASGGRERLTVTGDIRQGRARRWELEATITASNMVEAMEWQLTPDPPPTEVTTVALRSLGNHMFFTRIPPGGVPERVETAFEAGSLIVGPSVALLGLLAARAHVPPEMAKRSLFIRVDDGDLSIRLVDGIILQDKRTRGPGTDGREGWIRRVELRTAADAGRAESVLQVDGQGVAMSVDWPRAVPARSATLSQFEKGPGGPD